MHRDVVHLAHENTLLHAKRHLFWFHTKGTFSFLWQAQNQPIVARGKDPRWKALVFVYNKGICGFRGSGPRCQRGYHLCYKQGCHKAKPYHECSHSKEWLSKSHESAEAPPQPLPSAVSPQQPFAVGICCGKASLSRSLIDAGFSVLAVDHMLHDPQMPVTLLDLTQVQHQRILLDLLNSRPRGYLHLGMPCGTASRAQERPVARDKILQGAPQPPPLRSADPHPEKDWAKQISCIDLSLTSSLSLLIAPYRSGIQLSD